MGHLRAAGDIRTIRQHVEISHRIAKMFENTLPVASIVLQTHECWNGTGYPNQVKEDNISLDKSAHPTADILSQLFSYGETGDNKENAKQFGYQLGRVVYFLDAFDDYKKDMKDNSFNPFKNCDDIVDASTHTINMSIGALTETFNKQNFNNFSSIIENIIYDGLSLRLDRIIQKYRGEISE
jgi:hypothetical protein